MPISLVRCLLLFAFAALVAQPKNSSQSFSTLNISEMTGEESGALDYFPEIAVSGNYVHVVWVTDEGNPIVRVLDYRRSTDGGRTWERRQRLLADERLLTSGLSRRLAADGANVYILANASRLITAQGR